jgi:LacI family transcriptional regulator
VRTVAQAAGVSATTVSHVLNGGGAGATRVSEATRERVKKAAVELGYAPAQYARSMRIGRTEQVCLIADYPDTPWVQTMAREVSRAAAAQGYTTMMFIGDGWERHLLRQGADGVVIALGSMSAMDAEQLIPFVERGIGIVAVGKRMEPRGFDVVYWDDRAAAAAAMRHLLETRRRIAFLRNYPDTAGEKSARLASYVSQLRAAKIPLDPDLIRDTHGSREEAYREALDLLSGPDRPDAIFATSDLGAISALWAAHHLGIAVPAELSIVGVGSSSEGRLADPELTSVGPVDMLARVAETLIERVQDPGQPGRLIRVPWRLHRRGTT